MADHPRPSIEKSTPPPANAHGHAPAPATAQHSGHPDFRFRQLPPIFPAASPPSARPTTTDISTSNNFNLQVTSPSRRPQIQLPSIGSLGLLHDSGLLPPQQQQWPHQQPSPRQPMPPFTPRYPDTHLGYKLGSSHHEPDRPRSMGKELTPSHQNPPRRLSSSSALTASPSAPIYAKIDVSQQQQQQQQVALPDPASLLNGNQIHNVSIVPSTRRQQKEAYRKGSPIPQPRKRNRISVACIPCKKRKVKCDQAKPECGKCIGSKNPHGPCTYDPCVYDKKRPNATRPIKFRSRPPPSRDPSPEHQPDSHMPDAFQNGEQRTLQPGPPHILNGSVSSYAGSQSGSPRTYGGGSPSPRLRSRQIEAGDQPSPAALENEALKRELSALRRQVQELSQDRPQHQQPPILERRRSPTPRSVTQNGDERWRADKLVVPAHHQRPPQSFDPDAQ